MPRETSPDRLAERRRLGGAVRALRERRGVSQQAIADALGVHRVTVAKFEAGRHDLAMSHIRNLAKALGPVELDVLRFLLEFELRASDENEV